MYVKKLFGILFFGLFCSAIQAAVIDIDGTHVGRTFEGIGAVSAGANSRLLIDYEEPYRSDILDFLFQPKFGASFQHLKVELGGGTNSTSGAEPSHAINRDELNNPVSRGYEFWLMKEARDRNPDIILDFLPWAFPYWLGTPFGQKQDYADYFTAFLIEARDEWNINNVNWISAAKNESYTDLDWIKNYVRPTLDAAGFIDIRIQGPDGHGGQAWNMFDDIVYNPDYNSLVERIGYHYIDQGGDGRYPTQEMIDTGKIMWCSEDSVGPGAWSNGREIVRRMNKLYTNGKITQMQIWCPIDSCAEGVMLSNVGVMQGDTPWSGHYSTRPATWCVAHYTQFTEPGWVYLDDGCGYLTGAGNYATLKDPNTGDLSIIVYAENPETITFNLSGGLSASTVHVWKSTESHQFIQQLDITPVGGSFTINCSAESIYSLTTTTGQQKGTPPNPIPAASAFPFPYSEDFESSDVGATPKWISDMQGTYEVANCKGGRTGKCLQQLIPQIGDTWAYDWVNPHAPMTLFGSMNWTNYEASMDFYIEDGEIYLAVRKGETQKFCGYAFVINKGGSWRLCLDDVTDGNKILASGLIHSLQVDQWHNLKVRAIFDQIDAFVDDIRICSVVDATRSMGQPCLGGSFDLNQYDNIAVYPVGPTNSNWTLLDDTHPSLNWINWWGSWSDSNYYNETCRFTENLGSAVEFPFFGKYGRLIGLLRNDLGHLDVYLDDTFVTSVDCYNETVSYQSILYETDELPLGNHVLRFVVSGNKNPSSSGHEIVLDAFSYSQTAGSWCYIEPMSEPNQPVNYALAATASASSVWDSSYTADKANDGSWNTRWNSASEDVNGSWLEMDFGQSRTFSLVQFKQLADRIQGYKIQYYDGQWKDAHSGGPVGQSLVIVEFDPVTGTKARILIEEATTVPSIYEFEVYAEAIQFTPLYLDLDGSGKVDFNDLALMCAQWIRADCDTLCECDRADFHHDGIVDLLDFRVFCEQYTP